MSRAVIGYDAEGHKIYRDLGPSNGASGPALVRGSLVVGEPGPNDRAASTARQMRAKGHATKADWQRADRARKRAEREALREAS